MRMHHCMNKSLYEKGLKIGRRNRKKINDDENDYLKNVRDYEEPFQLFSLAFLAIII